MHSEKMILRQALRTRFASFPPESRRAASEKLAWQIAQIPAWRAASVIGLFAGRADEMETELLWPPAAGKKFCYPVVEDADLKFCSVASPANLLPGTWGLLEPAGAAEETPDFLLVPGLAFDATGTRLGRGRGYYDRWLARHPATVRWGVCFDFQMVSRVPAEAHDVRMDGVVTELAFYPAR